MRRPKFLKHLKVVRLRPGDTLVFRYEGYVSVDVAARIRQEVRQVFPDHKVIIIEKAELGVMHRG